jgi:hypothetical protein
MLDFDALRRSTGTSRPSSEMQQKLRIAEETVVTITAELNDVFDDLEVKRGYLLRNEFLTVAASQVTSTIFFSI